MLRKIRRGLTFVLTAVAAMLSLAACGGEDASAAWEVCRFANKMPAGVVFECDEAVYSPETAVITARLTNDSVQGGISFGADIYFAKKVGNRWGTVPGDYVFIMPMYGIGPDESHEFNAHTSMLEVKLDEGQYRLYKKVWIEDNAGRGKEYTVWAEFEVAGDAVAG